MSYAVRMEAGQRSARGQFRWFFGLVRVKLPGKPSRTKKADKPPDKDKPKTRSKPSRHSPLAALSVEGFIGHLLRLVRRLLAGLHIHHLDIRGRLGLGDPADTGLAWALVGPISVLLDAPGVTQVDIQPDFSQEVLDFSSNGRVRVVPLEYLTVMIRFMVSPTTFRAIRAMRS
ncbi:MAG: DUF2953 domain-containing protein [Natronospirillum sp.]|uniref:DUF2953 domain-containing protein n=1 Tax=Natronospirillum sp. TaxID=2812955 RepID=UPI0025EE2F18|nr:DUF2953 domain-containing protein [Natronospirillum sp.]MCH8552907.1 DUF2953 domain-containing protein [Natronospirillum sp.]